MFSSCCSEGGGDGGDGGDEGDGEKQTRKIYFFGDEEDELPPAVGKGESTKPNSNNC